jgi:REP element-mobilizing transposase RayT
VTVRPQAGLEQTLFPLPRPYGADVSGRLPRCLLPDGTFHVCTRGVDGTPIFRTDDDRRYFLRLFGDVVRRHDWLVHVFCLMTNHYHFVLEALREELSAGFHRLNGVYAQAFNRRYGRKGHLFGDRFWSGVIESDEEFENACAYVLENPVRAGLCAEPADWPWSGSRAERAAWRILGS